MTTSTTHPCSNCGEPVKATRPSTTGKHWCWREACVRAKNSFYRRRSREHARTSDDEEATALVAALANTGWERCPYCGQERALSGWQHPKPDWSEPCRKLGRRGNLLPDSWLHILWPPS